MSLGPAEILVVLVIALVVFGPKRLPEVGRQVGGALRELRKVQDTVQTEIRGVLDDTVGPVRSMHPNELFKDRAQPEIAQPEITPEPDFGDEHGAPAPEVGGPELDPPGPDIDGLSGGTFS